VSVTSKLKFLALDKLRNEGSNGAFTDTGQTIREAADAALANREAWK
jgi:hypothetical protein